MDLPDVAAVQHESRQLDLASSAAELHGGLCGWLSGGGADSADWLARILADTAQVAPRRAAPWTRCGRPPWRSWKTATLPSNCC